jgi:phosphate transport system permease protein
MAVPWEVWIGRRWRDYRLRRQWADVIARVLIRTGGLLVIVAILGMAFVLVAESWPLFRPPVFRAVGVSSEATPLPVLPSTLLMDEYGETLVGVAPDGQWHLLAWPSLKRLQTGVLVPPTEQVGPAGPTPPVLAGGADPWVHRGAVVTVSGQLWLWEPTWNWQYAGNRRTLVGLSMQTLAWTQVPLNPGEVVTRLTVQGGERLEQTRVVVLTDRHRLWLVLSRRAGGFLEEKWVPTLWEVRPYPPQAMSLALTQEYLYVGTSAGEVWVYKLSEEAPPVLQETVRLYPDPAPITAMTPLLGRFALAIGDARGRVCVAFPVPRPDGWRFVRVRDFRPQDGAVRAVVPAQLTRAFLTLTDRGAIAWHHSTAGTTRLEVRRPGTAWSYGVVARDLGSVLLVDAVGRGHAYDLRDPHPEVSLRALFGRVWYEGYDRPQFIWQSSSGTQTFEPKYSLVPLIFGTLKGTFYALVFAVPLALLGALYMGQFMHPTVRAQLKPLVELMAGLPSIVLGFVAGLWLAPRAETWFPALLVWHGAFLVGGLTSPLVWRLWPWKPQERIQRDWLQLVLVALWLVALFWICLAGNRAFEQVLFGGNYHQWFQQRFGWTYEQRNALVVGFAMGYTVVPIIFSIAEEAIAAVPRDWIAGALALGATPWQTLRSIVIPASLSGIVSAVMVGFGRAVGETMIVLMATGNTPVLDPSPFTGFRTISANLAVELPEAAVGDTHYRVLFLAALLLFGFTIAVNTVAELLRERVRRQYYR